MATIFEKIKAMNQDELRHFMCDLFDECDCCPVNKACEWGSNGFKKFLDQEKDIGNFLRHNDDRYDGNFEE